MQTVNNTDDGNGTAPPKELTDFAKSKGWESYDWQEATRYTFETAKDQCRFSPIGGDEILLTRAEGLPAWIRRRYYVGVSKSPVQSITCYCAVHEAGGAATEYEPETLPTTFDGDPKL